MNKIDSLSEICILRKKLEKERFYDKLCIAFIIGFFIFIFWFFYQLSSYNIYQTDIVYKNLSEEQINYIESILDEIDPFWLNSAKKITFTNNREDLCPIKNPCNRGGINIFKKIVILYDKSLYNRSDFSLRASICHELVHDFSDNEELAYKIGYDLICFED